MLRKVAYRRELFACIALALLTRAAAAADADPPGVFQAPVQQPKKSVFVFGGQFTTQGLVASLSPFAAHESNYIVGGSYQRDLQPLGNGWIFGGEIGLANRFGMGASGEVWAGLTFRNVGVVLLNTVRVAPGMTVGLSAITNPVGIEAQRERDRGGNARLLGYLGPELAIAFQQMPNLELVYRLHHRSGAGGTFGSMREGANANVFGIRYRFDHL
jgi:hypothetical protein